jgi:hypothetical protein
MANFKIAVDKWANKVTVDIKQFTKLVAFKVHDRIVERTPVDTGRARASWTIVAGETADTSVAPPDFAGGPEAGISAARSKQGNVQLAHSYVIANNLPYIERLENGHSKQAPAGMVGLAIADVRTELEISLGN